MTCRTSIKWSWSSKMQNIRWKLLTHFAPYRFRISLVNSCMCGEKTLTMQEADTGSTAESPAFCRFFLILCCLIYLSCQVDGRSAAELQCFPWNREISLGSLSHAKGPPLCEPCLPSLSTRNRQTWMVLDKCFWILNMQCCTTCVFIRHPKTRKHLLHVFSRSERSSRACESVQSCLNLGLSENRVYPQWNSHLIGIMIINHWG